MNQNCLQSSKDKVRIAKRGGCKGDVHNLRLVNLKLCTTPMDSERVISLHVNKLIN